MSDPPPWVWRKRRRPRTSHRKNKSQLYLELHPRPPRRGKEWRAARVAALTERCEITACNRLLVGFPRPRPIRKPEDFLRPAAKKRNLGHVDHIVCEAFLHMHGIADVHNPLNLASLCQKCHGAKTGRAEVHLFRGDLLRFVQVLRELHWPMERVFAALEFYGLKGNLLAK